MRRTLLCLKPRNYRFFFSLYPQRAKEQEKSSLVTPRGGGGLSHLLLFHFYITTLFSKRGFMAETLGLFCRRSDTGVC